MNDANPAMPESHGGSKTLVEVSFKPATGGMISETRHKTSGGKFGPDYKYDTAVHGSLGHAVRHLKAAFGHAGKKKAAVGKEKNASMRKG